ncbi:MAG: FAD-dependent 5-carboxymethylaminomethyl-2-thiouridine(34) oxidoreductase MnmC [Burkholderiales bacterium]|nr:FAD-dependent 5-carboxymethylaminomethyl-2-thiouridine(34) oxidoreductase MnmC [Burkholderiales bacterium]
MEVARLSESPSGHAPGVPYSPLYDDVYHAVAGAAQQARHVFLQGNGLPQRWQGRDQFVILETGFGLGNNFLETWAHWQADPQRCRHLFFVSVEKHPLPRSDLERVHAEGSPLASELIRAWPVLTPGLHTLSFEDERGQVTLLLGLGDVADILPKLVLQADAFYLDGFAPAKNPQMWDQAMLARLGRLAAPGATAATWSIARGVRDGLTQAGFVVTRAPGFASKRDMLQAVYSPRHQPALPAGGYQPPPAPQDRRALVIGAGLAGCAATWALCREGWQVTLVDRQPGMAQEASGNPGGMFHAVLHGEDGIHARAHRAAALQLVNAVAPWIQSGRLRGQIEGLLRLDKKFDFSTAQELIGRLGIPAEYVRWIEQQEARELTGVSVPAGGWLFRQAGWLHPAGLAKLLLEEAERWSAQHGHAVSYQWAQTVRGITRKVNADGTPYWQIQTANAKTHAAPYVVLANANGLNLLTEAMPDEDRVAKLPLTPIRGQITTMTDEAINQKSPPRIPIAGGGYALRLSDRSILTGATTQHHDDDPAIRAMDHRHNLAQAAALGVLKTAPDLAEVERLSQADSLQGRTGWRAATPDRLPLVGALPLSPDRLKDAAPRTRMDQVRMIPRERTPGSGLFVIGGLGSRGITWSILASRLLVHWMSGTPCPVEADLRDALDPARFVARDHCKQTP